MLLGRGGMGEVWRAADRRLGRRLGRRVAVKLLPASRAAGNGEAVARFHREARVMAALQHPGIVQVFDSGEQDGLLYLVMELLDGHDLRAVLGRAGQGRADVEHQVAGSEVAQVLGQGGDGGDVLTGERAGSAEGDPAAEGPKRWCRRRR
ncbi:protein kinase [Streptomyces sp. SP17BM10]|uniref:protein kinase domain-containing protein n=1 Tax=Streptomyces sp. SP17BM10 TaxID=3002530 RepID=UPI002E75D2B7|nr:protein kinase [Streptomyces sp. SP17BM10]MEE1782601.1 protein kinase [Streptomyces sp. SP17BM10]